MSEDNQLQITREGLQELGDREDLEASAILEILRVYAGDFEGLLNEADDSDLGASEVSDGHYDVMYIRGYHGAGSILVCLQHEDPEDPGNYEDIDGESYALVVVDPES